MAECTCPKPDAPTAVGGLRQVFENIFWPAAAGNVFWAFCTLLIDPQKPEFHVWPRLAFLLLLSVYLVIGWVRLREEPPNEKISGTYWRGEFFHLVAIAACAIAAQVQPRYLPYLLMAYFVGMAIGHGKNAWKLSDKTYPGSRLVAVHILGLVLLVLGLWGAYALGMHEGDAKNVRFWWEEWTIPISYGVPLVCWFAIRWESVKHIYRSLTSH